MRVLNVIMDAESGLFEIHGNGLKEEVSLPPVVLTMGSYDGVHLGHRHIIEEVKSMAAYLGTVSAIVTFDPHPREVLKKGGAAPLLLSTIDEKCALIERLGTDVVYVVRFSHHVSQLLPRDFVCRLLLHRLHAKGIVMGYDHGFGKDREGTLETVHALSEELGFSLHVVAALERDGAAVSSTRIRMLLLEGQITEANRLLGDPYSIGGVVIEGRKVGRTIGVPTANIKVLPNKLLPKFGVYGGEVVYNGKSYRAAVNIGVKPSVSDAMVPSVELHLLGFEGDLYGQSLRVHLLERLRDEMKFTSLEQLQAQIMSDIERIRVSPWTTENFFNV